MKIIHENRKSLIVAFFGVALYLSFSFLLRLWPALFSREFSFFYNLSIPIVFTGISLYGIASLILIFRAGRRKKTASKIEITGMCLLLSYALLTPVQLAVHRQLPAALPTGSGARAFDSKLWKTNESIQSNDGISVREQMLKDVVENTLPRKTKKQIEYLLGASLKTDYFSDSDKDLIYYLGPERDNLFTNIDSEWLLIWLNEKGQFEKYRIYND